MSERRLLLGDCRALLAEEPAESVHAVLTDPPYDLTTAGRWGNAKTPPQEGTDGAFRRLSGGFMGMHWDSTSVAFQPETWRAVFRVLKPGGFLVAFGGDRTHHRMMCAIEDAGFELRQTLAWCHATGFPKGHDVGKAIDRRLGAEREVVGTYQDPETGRVRKFEEHGFEPRFDALMGKSNGTEPRQVTAPATPEAEAWDGWNVALKPALEFLILARRPLEGSIAENILRHGCGALNIEAGRIGTAGSDDYGRSATRADGSMNPGLNGYGEANRAGHVQAPHSAGRYPSNLLLSHAEGCGEAACDPSCPVGLLDAQAGERTHPEKPRPGIVYGSRERAKQDNQVYGAGLATATPNLPPYGDTGGPSRFFATFPYESPLLYFPKPTRRERDAGCHALPDRTRNRVNPGGLEDEPRWAPVQAKNIHPCCKPVNLLRYLARLICPPGGVVLDPFAGSGSTGVACALEGFEFLGMEQEPDYLSIAEARCAHAARQADRGRPLLAKTRSLKKAAPGQGQLFGEQEP